MKRIGRITVCGIVVTAALYTFLAMSLGVSFYRPVALDNDPLTNSISITSVSINRLNLADGRVIVMQGFEPDRLSEYIRDSGGRVELDSVSSRYASVFVRRKIDNGDVSTRTPRVVIPVFRREYPTYCRYPLGLGEFQQAEDPTR